MKNLWLRQKQKKESKNVEGYFTLNVNYYNSGITWINDTTDSNDADDMHKIDSGSGGNHMCCGTSNANGSFGVEFQSEDDMHKIDSPPLTTGTYADTKGTYADDSGTYTTTYTIDASSI